MKMIMPKFIIFIKKLINGVLCSLNTNFEWMDRPDLISKDNEQLTVFKIPLNEERIEQLEYNTIKKYISRFINKHIYDNECSVTFNGEKLNDTYAKIPIIPIYIDTPQKKVKLHL